jgi:replicative DNA helicase
VQEVTEITKSLKALAKELAIPIIALSQLSRAVESREDKRPQLSDLRESGSIEQDADVVMFIYREAYYLERLEPGEGDPRHAEWAEQMGKKVNVAEVIIAKQRHGAIGRVDVGFNPARVKFSNLETRFNDSAPPSGGGGFIGGGGGGGGFGGGGGGWQNKPKGGGGGGSFLPDGQE